MANNEQNTYAGGGAPITANTGNGFLDGFLKLANVGIDVASAGYGIYQDKQDRELAREIEKINATRPPMQALPASQANSPAQYMSDPQNIQALLFYGISFVVIGGLSIYALNKL